MKAFKKVLIANRGEITVRITRTLQEMGIVAVVVYSDADATALHVLSADEAYPLEGNTAKETYLDTEKLLAIAKKADIDAIHPGYGFLSENAEFAAACEKAGLVFIGPKPSVITAMGDKIKAKALMEKTGVPVVPGWTGDTSDIKALERAAESIGYPVLIKAAAGGGGKGMRLVNNPAELADAVAGASREAEKAFNDARIFMEKYIVAPRHIEFQIFGDGEGNVVHLFERDCSIQRRHQKVIEESPAPGLSHRLREAMGQAAVKAAKTLGYTNAGTVEFIVDAAGNFYFLEVNTRLQVEHPVTELVVGMDLVRLQLNIAMGHPLPFQQADLTQAGHAFECRIYAEDPSNQFLPAIGMLAVYHEPQGPGIRVDSGVRQGQAVSVYYDPMLAKLIVWAETRPLALEKLRWALLHYPVLGVATNIGFLQGIVANSDFQQGGVDTHFLNHHSVESLLLPPSQTGLADEIYALIAAQPQTQRSANGNGQTTYDPWRQMGPWRPILEAGV